MNSNLKTSEVLDLAADKIQEFGWAKGTGWPSDVPGVHVSPELCLEGGIVAALGMKFNTSEDEQIFTTCPAYAAVQDYLDTSHPLYIWNDLNGSQGRVIETLRAAAAVERVKEATASATYDTADQPLPVDIPETSAA